MSKQIHYISTTEIGSQVAFMIMLSCCKEQYDFYIKSLKQLCSKTKNIKINMNEKVMIFFDDLNTKNSHVLQVVVPLEYVLGFYTL